ncbi:Hypothetical protein GLP15_2190 [Giardia lamblia P15]|uniref:Uncharacterized protein n=1 Tax=Giardia intestinalis (strain P15) TaxID=658858 RepID=E1F6W1_GIAIA|nr:Hypothetical protein GLP15_2190 [Giardia lamblia P15]
MCVLQHMGNISDLPARFAAGPHSTISATQLLQTAPKPRKQPVYSWQKATNLRQKIKIMAFAAKSADMLILSDVMTPGIHEEQAPPRPKSAIPQESPMLGAETIVNVPSIPQMLECINTNVAKIPENVRQVLEDDKSFKELTLTGAEFLKGLDTNPKKRIQQEERMIEFRQVVSGIFKTYDLFSNDVIHAKIRSMADLLCYHAKRIYKENCKNRQEVVFTCLSYYLLKRHVIEDSTQQYHILNTIIESSLMHTPRRIKSPARKKYSFYY